MGRKPVSDERPSGKAAKPKDAASASAKDGKKERMSVFALLASMDQKPKGSAAATSKKPKPKPTVSSYTDDIDLPPSDEEKEVGSDGDVRGTSSSASRSGAGKPVVELSVGPSNKELKKREKKEQIALQAVEIAKQEPLKDDRDTFEGSCQIPPLPFLLLRSLHLPSYLMLSGTVGLARLGHTAEAGRRPAWGDPCPPPPRYSQPLLWPNCGSI